ncbi:unnamed protein product [Pocillopora meandrina]|uniref:Uncharacterized protein n=1 Tax=Pocillopora meandrina TaxID=46732 RepID=A0AAU9XP63_9CNID|nr:unnamed protein product [Pocillopora meandrina]
MNPRRGFLCRALRKSERILARYFKGINWPEKFHGVDRDVVCGVRAIWRREFAISVSSFKEFSTEEKFL